jgi:uncharacterized protein YbjT (DUF2867 family)
VPTYVLVSSSGADHRSKLFYTKMKGELDRNVKQLPFKSVCILKPSVLVGERDEKRPGETVAIVLGNTLTPIIPSLRKYRPIPAKLVAKAMINSAQATESGIGEYELDEVAELAKKEGT